MCDDRPAVEGSAANLSAASPACSGGNGAALAFSKILLSAASSLKGEGFSENCDLPEDLSPHPFLKPSLHIGTQLNQNMGRMFIVYLMMFGSA